MAETVHGVDEQGAIHFRNKKMNNKPTEVIQSSENKANKECALKMDNANGKFFTTSLSKAKKKKSRSVPSKKP